MSYNLNQVSGATGVFSKAGVAIGSTTSQYSFANTIQYAINGRAYSKAADASEAFVAATGAAALANIPSTGGACVFLLLTNAAGDLHVAQGAIVGRNDAVPLPAIPPGYVCYGAVKIATGTTFTVGTTALTGVATYYDFAGHPGVSAL